MRIVKTLAVSGRDLLSAGFMPGRKMGEVLELLLEEVLEDPEKNTREYLLSRAVEVMKEA